MAGTVGVMVLVSLPDQSWIDDLGPIDGVEMLVWDPREDPPDDDIEVMVAPYLDEGQAAAALAEKPSVRLLQLLTAGYDSVAGRMPEGVALANARGLHDTATAELALGLIIAAQRRIDDAVRHQATGEWTDLTFAPGLADRQVTLVGYGSVGAAVVRRLLACEADVTAVASRARDGDDLVDQVHGIDELPDLLPGTEILVVVTPLTEHTRHLVDDETLAALPDDALVVNVGRGPVLDTDAALRHAGRLRFALDVTDPEPLPPEHPLWSAPGVLITPHVGGASQAFRPRALALLREQLTRLGRGEEPLHLV